MAKSWIEKRNCTKDHVIKTLDKDFADMKAGQTMLVPTAKIIQHAIEAIPEGQSFDVRYLRNKLADDYKADVTCPVTTGIKLRICAEAAFEEFNTGKDLSQITPFWRVMDKETSTTKKLSFDSAFITQQREREHIN